MLFTYFNIYIRGQVDPGQFKAFPAGPFNVMPFSLFGLIFLTKTNTVIALFSLVKFQ